MGADAVRIGVTGHRAISARGAVERAVDALLDRLIVPPASAVVLSALAEGADRLVAERVLARPVTRLHAILPLPAGDYATDFADSTSVAEFERLLVQAESVAITGPGPDGSRSSAYERAGHAVVDGSDVLVAVWDGAASRGRGGTAEIVEYAARRGVPVEVIPVLRSQPA